MPEFHEKRDGRTERERPLRPADDVGSVSDREVPLPGNTPDVINRWLDGELPEPTGLRGDAARTVEFWRRLGEETDTRRRMQTPVHLSAKIMAALPPMASVQADVTPWFRRDLRVSASVAIAAGAALFTLGLIVARAFF
ncbi:MAG: hypothetical protein ABIT38_14110 [Gemmatimonadaceae bacterium]